MPEHSKYTNASDRKGERVPSEGLTVHRYPTDVGSNEYPNYILFNIIKRAGDIGNTEAKVNAARGKMHSFMSESNTSGQNRNDTSAALGKRAAKLAVAVGTAKVVKDIAKGLGDLAGAPDATTDNIFVGGVSIGAGIAAGAAFDMGGNRDRILLKTTIALHLNNKPSVSYKAQWADQDLGLLASNLNTTETFINSVTNDTSFKNITAAAEKALKGYGESAGILALKKSNETVLKEFGDFRSFFEANTGQAINPFKAQLFKNMDFRTFSFDYVFLPRDETEYESVQTIIKTFKRYMHPSYKGENVFMGYPAEFNITYFHKAGENSQNIFKLAGCALTDLKVEYGGSDFVTFKGTGGAPTEIAMSLSFLELELLTEERVMDGY